MGSKITRRDASEDRQPGRGPGDGRRAGTRPPNRPTEAEYIASATPRVLLLNAGYEALTALPARRAVVMLLCGKADVVHDHPEAHLVRSATESVRVPSVIRLREYVHIPYRAQIPMTRAALMHRDGHRCGYCGARADTIDHVVPRSRGGAHGWENCVACCAKCNHRKADKLLGELGWTLRHRLEAPRGRTWRLVSSIREMGPHWEDYLHAA